MKKNTHPKWNKKASFKVNGSQVAEVGSTQDEVNVVIWSGNHPYYTGEEVFVDTDNLVEKFNEKVENAKKSKKKLRNKSQRRKDRRTKRTSTKGNKEVTLKDMLKNLK